MSAATVWPRAEVSLSQEGRVRINIGGVTSTPETENLEGARAVVVDFIARRAAALGRAIPTSIQEPTGTWQVDIHPDGTVSSDDADPDEESESGAGVDAGPRAGRGAATASGVSELERIFADSDPPSRLPPPPPPPAVPSSASSPVPVAAGPAAPASPPTVSTPIGPAEPAGLAEPTGPIMYVPDPVPAATARTASASAEIEPSSRGRRRRERRDRGGREASAPTAFGGPARPLADGAGPPEERRIARGMRPPVASADAPAPPPETARQSPASTGWRGAVNHVGLHLSPSSTELLHRAEAAAVSAHWRGPRTVAVVNGKGGAGKTPTTILLSAVFARYGGAGVVAFDNSPTRGTLSWRTEPGPHASTVIDLLACADRLLALRARPAHIAGLVHHQQQDCYDVLRSRSEVLTDATVLDASTFQRAHDVLSRYYRLIVIDSSNDESSPLWRAAIARADALVVPTITRPEHAESARLLLDELSRADARAARLARRALVIVSRSSRTEPEPREFVEAFSRISRSAVAIPYDAAMSDRPLRLDSLAPATRQAWISASAALATTLSTTAGETL